MNGFARRLVLKQRQRVTRNWPILGNFQDGGKTHEENEEKSRNQGVSYRTVQV